MSVLMTCCGNRYETVRETIGHICPKITDTIKVTKDGVRVAKGIVGIRKFIAIDAEKTGWHVMVEESYIGYFPQSGIELIKQFSTMGRTFIGWTGNGLSFKK